MGVQLSSWAAALPFKLTGASAHYPGFCAPQPSPAWPDELTLLVRRCCALDQDARPSMKEVLAVLEKWMHG